MPVRAEQVTDPDGSLYIEESDADTGDLLRRIRLAGDRQPLKIRLWDALHDSAQELMEIRWRIDHIVDYSLAPAVQTATLAALNAQYTAALNRDKALMLRWRNAP
jgi:hypothetical protein